MVNIHGPANWSTVTTLQAATAHIEADFDLAWGVTHPTMFGGQPKLNAIKQLTAMMEADLRVPVWTTNLEIAMEWAKQGLGVFGRRLHHSQGTDIQLPYKHNTRTFRRKWLESEWWVPVLPVIDEWRLHVWDGKIIARAKKGQVRPPTRVAAVRNVRNGWAMIHTEAPTDEMRSVAKAAVAAVGYDFGAVDLATLPDNELVVFEVNSAPGLQNPYTIGAYVKAIERTANARQQ